MKATILTVLALLLFVPSWSQLPANNCPLNIDFELGNFNFWQCSIGNTSSNFGVNTIMLNNSGPTANQHEIITSATALDSYGLFPQRCPYGGGVSVKLGNSGANRQAEGLSYTFQIPPLADTFSLTYYYAVVFEDPNHAPSEQPRFSVSAYDVLTGAVINCAAYSYVSSSSIPGFQQSPVDPNVIYKDWTPVSIDFAGLSGRTVRLEFKTADCTLGAHFGYAYVDVGTGCLGTLATAPYCVETNLVHLNAPYGFQTYTWYNSNYTAVLGTGQLLTLSPPPAINTLFHVDMIPYPGFGCRDTADAIVRPLPVPDTPVATSEYRYCQGASAPSLSATAAPEHILRWYTSATGGTGSDTPPIPATNQSGIFYYYVTQKTLFGCESKRKPIKVQVIPKPTTIFSVNSNRQCEAGNQFVFTNTSTDTTGGNWLWDFGDSQTSSSWNASHSYNRPGNFLARLTITTATGCSSQYAIPLTVVPKPIASFTYPSVICAHQTPVVVTANASIAGGLSTVSNWQWWFNGNPATGQTPPSFTAAPGWLLTQLVASTTEGCQSDTVSHNLRVHYLPTASLQFTGPICSAETISFNDRSSLPTPAAPDIINRWNWQFNDGAIYTAPNFSRSFTVGLYTLRLTAESNVGCKSNPLDTSFTVYPKPRIQLQTSDSCIKRNILYKATDIDGNVAKWRWNFGNGYAPGAAQVSKYYFDAANLSIGLIGETLQGCKDTFARPFTIYSLSTRLPVDTVVAKSEPVLIDPRAQGDTSGAQYIWTPGIGLNDPSAKTPIALWETDQRYSLKAVSVHGCDSYSKILVRRYKGPELFIPTGFTPNGDGLNDVARVFPVGIRSFQYFSVYNRHGQLIFHTTDYTQGWDGTYKGANVEAGNFVVVAKTIDYKGNVLFKKQNLLLLR